MLKGQNILKAGLLLTMLATIVAGLALGLDDPEQKVAGVIKNYIIITAKHPEWLKDEIRINFKFSEKTFDRLAKLPAATKIKVIEVYQNFKPVGSVVFPLAVTYNGLTDKLFVRAKVEVMKSIVVAQKLIKKGQIVSTEDFKLETRDVALLPSKYLAEFYSLAGQMARTTIPANSTIFEWMVGDQPLIKKGSEVDLTVVSPGLSVKTKAIATEDGYRGGEIKVKCQDSKKIISGKVIDAGKVEVKL